MPGRLVTIATFQDPVAATLAKNFLDSEDIPAILLDESTVATDWALAGAIGGIKLQVPVIHVERAELMLAQIQEERLADEEADAPPLTSFANEDAAEELRAENEDKNPVNQLADRIYRSAVFGLLFWPLQVYVLWLLLQLAGTEGAVSPNRRWKIWVAVMFNLPILFISFYFVSNFISR